MKTKITGCPHCGGRAYLEQNYYYKARSFIVYVKCSICGAQGKVFHAEEEPAAADWNTMECNAAIQAWNMRTTGKEL